MRSWQALEPPAVQICTPGGHSLAPALAMESTGRGVAAAGSRMAFRARVFNAFGMSTGVSQLVALESFGCRCSDGGVPFVRCNLSNCRSHPRLTPKFTCVDVGTARSGRSGSQFFSLNSMISVLTMRLLKRTWD